MNRKAFDRFTRKLVRGLSGFSEHGAQQHFANETNIHNIVSKAREKMVMPGSDMLIRDRRAPIYGDFSQPMDAQAAFEAIRQTEEGFMKLSPETRRFFENSPVKMMMFVTEPKNREKSIELGLIDQPEEDRSLKAGEAIEKKIEVTPAAPAPAPGAQ